MNRAFVFSVDAVLALSIVVLALVSIDYFSYQAEKSPYLKLQLERTGSDALSALDLAGALNSGNRTLIEERLNETMPPNMGAHLQVLTYYKEASGFSLLASEDYGAQVPANITRYQVERGFVSISSRVTNYSIAKMSIWEK